MAKRNAAAVAWQGYGKTQRVAAAARHEHGKTQRVAAAAAAGDMAKRSVLQLQPQQEIWQNATPQP